MDDVERRRLGGLGARGRKGFVCKWNRTDVGASARRTGDSADGRKRSHPVAGRKLRDDPEERRGCRLLLRGGFAFRAGAPLKPLLAVRPRVRAQVSPLATGALLGLERGRPPEPPRRTDEANVPVRRRASCLEARARARATHAAPRAIALPGGLASLACVLVADFSNPPVHTLPCHGSLHRADVRCAVFPYFRVRRNRARQHSQAEHRWRLSS
jgi:hypothetical protein